MRNWLNKPFNATAEQSIMKVPLHEHAHTISIPSLPQFPATEPTKPLAQVLPILP
jgi:hypothetical protein